MIARQTPIASTGASLIVQAPAKLNLYLDVKTRRPDGYHDLETLIVPITLCDTLRLVRKSKGDRGISLRLHDCTARKTAGGHIADGHGVETLPTDDRNLVVKAIAAIRSALGITSGVAIDLWKRIPSRAGLGGGSSDAAAALRAGLQLWSEPGRNMLSPSKLLDIAAGLGSDVPVMLGPQAAVCRGRGELVERTRLPAGLACVLVKPPEGLGAGEVFSELTASDFRNHQAGRLTRLIGALRTGRLREAGRWMANDLEFPAGRLTPWIARIREVFATLPVAAHQMSGSGSVYFGLCYSHRQANQIAAQLRQFFSGGSSSTWVSVAATC